MDLRFVLTVCVFGVASAYECQFYNDDTGVTYDLSGLQNYDADYTVIKWGVTYNINLCQASMATDCRADTAICAVPNNGDSAFSVGSALDVTSQGSNASAAVSLYFFNGDYDAHHQTYRAATINFICGVDLGDYSDAIKLVAKDADSWTFEWATSIVCSNASVPSGDSSSSSYVVDPFFVTLIVVVPVLLLIVFIVSIAFCCYCCRRRRQASRSALPTKQTAALRPAETQPLIQHQQASVGGPYGMQYMYSAGPAGYGLQQMPMMAPTTAFGQGNVQADMPVYIPVMLAPHQQFQQQQFQQALHPQVVTVVETEGTTGK